MPPQIISVQALQQIISVQALQQIILVQALQQIILGIAQLHHITEVTLYTLVAQYHILFICKVVLRIEL